MYYVYLLLYCFCDFIFTNYILDSIKYRMRFEVFVGSLIQCILFAKHIEG
uniref:Uncharacterized protein n=1 Tax=Manihot esculenta TaxID=3983 RepID=A0A2C9VGK6_MANES